MIHTSKYTTLYFKQYMSFTIGGSALVPKKIYEREQSHQNQYREHKVTLDTIKKTTHQRNT
jgi:hypothetical protein